MLTEEQKKQMRANTAKYEAAIAGQVRQEMRAKIPAPKAHDPGAAQEIASGLMGMMLGLCGLAGAWIIFTNGFTLLGIVLLIIPIVLQPLISNR